MHTWDYLGVHFSTSSVPTSQSAPYHGQDWDQLVDSRLKDELQKLDRTGCSHWEWIYRVKFHVHTSTVGTSDMLSQTNLRYIMECCRILPDAHAQPDDVSSDMSH